MLVMGAGHLDLPPPAAATCCEAPCWSGVEASSLVTIVAGQMVDVRQEEEKRVFASTIRGVALDTLRSETRHKLVLEASLALSRLTQITSL